MSEPFANPEAPSEQKKNEDVDGMSNADFRNFLTKNPTGDDQFPVSVKEKGEDDEQLEKRKRRRKYKKDALKESKYRDRAEERRNGLNKDYERIDEELGFSLIDEFEGEQMPDGGAVPKKKIISIEESKFLGGDEEHTHLVKGLDFALLHKKKKEIEAEEQIKASQNEQEDEEDSGPTKSDFALAIENLILKDEIKQIDMFLPKRTGYIFDLDPNFADEIPITVKRSKDDFQQGDESLAKIDALIIDKLGKIVASLKQKKKERRERRRLKKLGLLLPEEKKMKEVTPLKFEFEDDDIFPDVGEYEFKVDAKANVKKTDSYFNQDDDYAENNVSGPQMPQNMPQDFSAYGLKEIGDDDQDVDMEVDDGLDMEIDSIGKTPIQTPTHRQQTTSNSNSVNNLVNSAVKSQESTGPYSKKVTIGNSKKRKLEIRPRDEGDIAFDIVATGGEREKEKDPNFISSHYAEAFPGSYFGFDSVIGSDSDEEEDLTKMDFGTKKGRLKRKQFDTEEGWSEYNLKKEATPKAAFQFGVKMSGGRQTRRTKKDKASTELKKVNKILLEKYGKAYESETTAEKDHPNFFEASENKSEPPRKRKKFLDV